jgi:hypothetical protein
MYNGVISEESLAVMVIALADSLERGREAYTGILRRHHCQPCSEVIAKDAFKDSPRNPDGTFKLLPKHEATIPKKDD